MTRPVRRSPVSPKLATAVVVGLLVVVAVVSTWAAAYFGDGRTRTVDAAPPTVLIADSDAVAVARAVTDSIYTMTPTTTGTQTAIFKDNACGKFRDDYLKTLQQLVDQVKASKAGTTGTILDMAPVNHPPSSPSATVIAVVRSQRDQTATSPSLRSTSLTFRMVYTVTRQDGRLCVSGADFS